MSPPQTGTDNQSHLQVMGTVAPIVRRTHAELNKSANVGFERGPFYDRHTVASIDLG